MPKMIAPFLLLTALLAGCASAPKVGTDFDPAYDFASVASFAVMRPNAMLARSGGQLGSELNDLQAGRLERYITDDLQSRGFKVVPVAQADAIVTFFVNTEDKSRVRSYNSGISYRRCWDIRFCNNWGTPEVEVDEYKEGTLLLDIVDKNSGELKWRGTATDRLPSKTPSSEERERLGRAVVASILDQFPPQ